MSIIRSSALAFAVIALAAAGAMAQSRPSAIGADELWCRAEGVGLSRCVESRARCEAPARGIANDCHQLDRVMYCFEIIARGHDAAENGLLECHATAAACHEGRKATARARDISRKPSRCEAVGPQIGDGGGIQREE